MTFIVQMFNFYYLDFHSLKLVFSLLLYTELTLVSYDLFIILSNYGSPNIVGYQGLDLLHAVYYYYSAKDYYVTITHVNFSNLADN